MRIDPLLALAALAAGLLALLAAAFLQVTGLGPNPAYLLIAGVALLICGAILDPGAVAGLARSRRGRFGALSTGIAAGVLAALLLVNVAASRGQQHLDLTGSQLHSLAPKSKAVLGQLRGDLTIIAFAAPSSAGRSSLADLLGLYQEASPRVKVRFVDPNTDLAEAQALGVTSPDSLVLEYAGRRPVVLSPGSQAEQDVTGGILKLELNRQLTLCWAAGDGERDLQSTDPLTGYSTAAQALGGDDFAPRQLVLGQVQSIPGECDVVAVVGPTQPLAAASTTALKTYLAAGGRLFLAADPWRSDVDASFNQVLQPSGLQLDGALVVDDAAHTASGRPALPVVVSYGDSPITKDLRDQVSLFPVTTSISGKPRGQLAVLATSSGASYEIAAPRQDLSRGPSDRGGPFSLLVAYEQPAGSGRERIVVAGSSALGQNQVVPPQAGSANLELLLGSLDWLSGEDALIALPPKPAGPQPLTLSAGQAAFDLVVSLVLLPLAILAGGFAVWWARRRTPFAAEL